MPTITQNPSWTNLSFTPFNKYLPLIKRWIKVAKSTRSSTEMSIRSLFLKIFFITIAERLLKPDYSSLLNREFLRKYTIKSSEFPKHISTFQDIFTMRVKNIPENMLLNFYLVIIHRTFKFAARKLNITVKSELKTPKNVLFSKSYEIKMLVQMIHSDFSKLTYPFVQYGGVAAIFTEFLSNYFNDVRHIPNKKHSEKKRTGSIFTPLWIVKLILRRLESKDFGDSADIADISVGYGSFLESFLTDPISKSQSNNLFGFDSDPLKIDILKFNHAIARQARFPCIELSNLKYQDSLLHAPTQQFEIIVGNPPWGAKLNKAQISQIPDLTQFTVKQYDSFGLFLIRSILSLKENGIVYLVLPETILLNPNYEQIRKYLLRQTQLLEIFHLGENIFENVNMPAIILGLQKSPPQTGHKIKIYHDINEKTIIDTIVPSIKRDQQEFAQNEKFVFDVFTKNEDRVIIEKMDNIPSCRLQELVDNSRGVEIGKKGEVIQCYHCKVWMPKPVWTLDNQTGTKFANCSVCKHKIYLRRLKNRDRIILDQKPGNEIKNPYSKFYIGENIHKYKLIGSKFIILERRGIKYKAAKIYTQNKILIRKTSRELLATIDYDNSYTIQVVYQLSLKEHFKSYPYLLEFILGVISSQIMQFYYAKKYQYANRKSFPHHIQKNILSLPIPKIEFSLENGTYSKFYKQIIFSTMMLMFLAYYEEFHTIHLSLNVKLTAFIKKNPNILEIIDLPKETKEFFFQSLDTVKNFPSKVDNLKETIDYFQKILDNTVERLYLALD